MASTLENHGVWLACCLSRGPRAPLSESDVAQLADRMGEEHYKAGTFIFHMGDPAAKVHVLRTGSVELSCLLGGRRVILQVLRPGDVFGDVPVFLGNPESFDARAIEDCTGLALDFAELFQVLQTRPMVARRWFVSIAERMSGFQNRLVDLLAGDIERQLASVLLRDADETGRVRVTQSALAGMLGAQRSSIQRSLKRLESADLLELSYGSIGLLDRGALASLIVDAKPDSAATADSLN